jgi:hypothetical protein
MSQRRGAALTHHQISDALVWKKALEAQSKYPTHEDTERAWRIGEMRADRRRVEFALERALDRANEPPPYVPPGGVRVARSDKDALRAYALEAELGAIDKAILALREEGPVEALAHARRNAGGAPVQAARAAAAAAVARLASEGGRGGRRGV